MGSKYSSIFATAGFHAVVITVWIYVHLNSWIQCLITGIPLLLSPGAPWGNAVNVEHLDELLRGLYHA
jgi:hypothetical protein